MKKERDHLVCNQRKLSNLPSLMVHPSIHPSIHLHLLIRGRVTGGKQFKQKAQTSLPLATLTSSDWGVPR